MNGTRGGFKRFRRLRTDQACTKKGAPGYVGAPVNWEVGGVPSDGTLRQRRGNTGLLIFLPAFPGAPPRRRRPQAPAIRKMPSEKPAGELVHRWSGLLPNLLS